MHFRDLKPFCTFNAHTQVIHRTAFESYFNTQFDLKIVFFLQLQSLIIDSYFYMYARTNSKTRIKNLFLKSSSCDRRVLLTPLHYSNCLFMATGLSKIVIGFERMMVKKKIMDAELLDNFEGFLPEFKLDLSRIKF